MTDILGLTSFSNIRGVLAVSPSDLPDEGLEGFALADDLQTDLEAWKPDWESVVDGSKEARLLRLYAKYRCAAWVATAGQNFMLKKFSDGANEGQRSDSEGFQALREHMEDRAREYRSQLEDKPQDASSSSYTPLFGVSKPDRDPVTTGRNNVLG